MPDHEFVELTNVGATTLNLTGWVLTDSHHALSGTDATSLSGVTAIAAESPSSFPTSFRRTSVRSGPAGHGSGDPGAGRPRLRWGDSVELYDNQGNLADSVDYTAAVANASYYAPKTWLGANSFGNWEQYSSADVTAGDAISQPDLRK